MNRSISVVFFLAAGASVAPAPAGAKIPNPALSQVDPVLIGDAGGAHSFRVVLRDIADLPIVGAAAMLDFSRTSVRIYSIQEPGVTFDCASRTLARMTLGDGSATFHLRFGGHANGNDVQISGNGVVISNIPARSTDMDELDGCTGLGDFGMFAERFLSPLPHPEADFDNSGGPVGLGDFSIFSQDLLSDVKGTYCP